MFVFNPGIESVMEAKCVPILQVRVRTEPQGLSGVHLCAGHMPVNTAPVSMDPWRSQEIPRRRSGSTGRAVPHRCPRQCPAWSRIRFHPGEERESARRRFLPQDGLLSFIFVSVSAPSENLIISYPKSPKQFYHIITKTGGISRCRQYEFLKEKGHIPAGKSE